VGVARDAPGGQVLLDERAPVYADAVGKSPPARCSGRECGNRRWTSTPGVPTITAASCERWNPVAVALL
jgi:hypothetical protein